MVESVTNQNMGSFVLGPLSVNPVELANVSASIADPGRWCEPSPVLSVTDSQGADVDLGTAPVTRSSTRRAPTHSPSA